MEMWRRHLSFSVDSKQAYGSVNRVALYKELEKLGIPEILVSYIALHKRTSGSDIDVNGTIVNKQQQVITYDDDIDTIARSSHAVRANKYPKSETKGPWYWIRDKRRQDKGYGGKGSTKDWANLEHCIVEDNIEGRQEVYGI